MAAPILRKTATIIICAVLIIIARYNNNYGAVINGGKLYIPSGHYLVLCYHAVLPHPPAWSKYSISRQAFARQMDFLKQHGFNVISFQQLLEASKGKSNLPPNSILLTFDDAYSSFYDYVLPILEHYQFPAVLAVVGSWIDNPPNNLPEKLMTWEELKKVAKHPLVEIASHSYNLHRALQYNPLGNVGPAVNVRQYIGSEKRYETFSEYRSRLETDFQLQEDLFKSKLSLHPRIMIWPYGKFNSISQEVAWQFGYVADFNLEEGFNKPSMLHSIKRLMIEQSDENDYIKNAIKYLSLPEPAIRAVQVDLDLIFDPNSLEQTDKNLGHLIDRLVELKVNTVFLQAFSDIEGTGNIKSVYFPNRVLPVKADIFSHAVHQIMIRNMQVYAWMPTIGIVLPDPQKNSKLAVKELTKDGKIRRSTSWYNRLTPFSKETENLLFMLYEDLAFSSQIHGILFQDDAYLTDVEDMNAATKPFIKKIFKTNKISKEILVQQNALSQKWSQVKTDKLIELLNHLKQAVTRFRPTAKFARNLYARVVMEPKSKLWFAQDFDRYLMEYDYTVLMAYPFMEGARNKNKWLDTLIKKVSSRKLGLEKTIFKLQTFDWKNNKWIPAEWLYSAMRQILKNGGRHIAYYPDNVWEDKPKLDLIKLEMSTKDIPFNKPK